MHYQVMNGRPSPLTEEQLEELYEGLARGDWQTVFVLPMGEMLQVVCYAQAKSAQWLADLEARAEACPLNYEPRHTSCR